MKAHPQLLKYTDGALAVLLALIVVGTGLAFGGSVWWVRPVVAVCLTTAVGISGLKILLTRRATVLKSPLAALGTLALGLAIVQLTPLPGRIAEKLSRGSRAAHALGVLPDKVHVDDPDISIPDPVAGRTPASLDRSATLRWLLGAMGCLCLFVLCSHFADRIGRSALIWGCVLATFFVGTTFGVVQLLGGVPGLYGMIEPGTGRPGTPSLDDVSSTPGATVLRTIGDPGRPAAGVVARPDRLFQFGTMMGGPGSYLALGSLALPLAFGVTLQLMAPRGSRERLLARLRDSGKSGLVLLLMLLTLTGSFLVGHLAGLVLSLPFAVGIVLVGLPAAWSSGLKWSCVGLTVLVLTTLGAGIGWGEYRGRPEGFELPAARRELETVRQRYQEAASISRDFPMIGVGFGCYRVIAPYYKASDESPTTARSSLLQWWTESGAVGMGLLAMGVLWCLIKLPGSVRRVGTGDRILAFTLVGTMVCFTCFSALHWTVEVTAVAIAACAVGGTCNRWLAGGTDLFVESV